jgi:lysophospholipase L1-like esterase
VGPRPVALSVGSRLAAVAIGLVAGLIACELVLRIARPAALQPGLEDVEPFVVPDVTLGWVGRPNLQTEVRFEPVFRHQVSTNSRGLRNRETPYARDARRRILCVGDSFTWGLGVEGEDAFPARLERGLPGTEVVNAGVIGWGTAQEWLWLEGEGARYTPDILILGFHVSDFWENAGSTLRKLRPLFGARDGALVLLTPPSVVPGGPGHPAFVGGPARSWSESLMRFLHMHSRVVRAVQLGAEWLRKGLLEPADLTPLSRATLRKEADSAVPPAQDVTSALLRSIRDFCGRRGIRLIVLLIPGYEDVEPELEGTPRARDPHAAYETAVRICRELRLDAVELRPRLVEMERSGTAAFHRGDIHLTAAGHRAAAELLAERIAGP